MKVTSNERAILDCLARNCYCPCNYGRPKTFSDTGATWSHSILETGSVYASTINPNSVGGIVTSLVRKGLVITADTGNENASTGLTEAGFALWLELFPTNSDAKPVTENAAPAVEVTPDKAILDRQRVVNEMFAALRVNHDVRESAARLYLLDCTVTELETAAFINGDFTKAATKKTPAPIKLDCRCNECGKKWKVSPKNLDPQCPRCNSVDYEVA